MNCLTINGTGFNLDSVLTFENKAAWLEWSMPRHYEGYNDKVKTRFLSEAWDAAQKLKPNEAKQPKGQSTKDKGSA